MLFWHNLLALFSEVTHLSKKTAPERIAILSGATKLTKPKLITNNLLSHTALYLSKYFITHIIWFSKWQ